MKLITRLVKNIDKVANVLKFVNVVSKTIDSFKDHYYEAFPEQKESGTIKIV